MKTSPNSARACVIATLLLCFNGLLCSCESKKSVETTSTTEATSADTTAAAKSVDSTAVFGYDSATDDAVADWTILVYLNGDNNLESAALEDFAEMADARDDARINVVVQFDRSPKYSSSFGNWSNTLRFKIKNGLTPYPGNALQDEESTQLGEVNMGSAQELAKFVSWGKKHYPAKHYLLDIWGHGQGWRTQKLQAGNIIAAIDSKPSSKTAQGKRAITVLDTLTIKPGNGNAAVKSILDKVPNTAAAGSTLAVLATEIHQKTANESVYIATTNDETSLSLNKSVSPDDSNGGILYNASIQHALSDARLDVIGFDACLMAMVETSYALQRVAKVMVASEALEPNEGWDYTACLENLENALQNAPSHSIDARTMGTLLVDSYARVPGSTNTLSAVDLSLIEPLAQRISALSTSLMNNMSAEAPHVQAARTACVHYAEDEATYIPSLNAEIPSFHHIDLAAFCTKLVSYTQNQQVRTAANEVMNALNRSVIRSFAAKRATTEQGSHGLAIYFPAMQSYYDRDPYADGAYRRENKIHAVQFVHDTQWVDFLQSYYSSPGISPQPSQPLHMTFAPPKSSTAISLAYNQGPGIYDGSL